MEKVNFHLQYTLTRGQRFRALLASWGWWGVFLPAAIILFWLAMGVYHALMREWGESLGFAAFVGAAMLFLRPLFAALFDIAMTPQRVMDLTFEESSDGTTAMGILRGGQRWLVFLDGMTAIEKECRDLWTFRHHNGTVVHIPVSVITDEQIEYVRQEMRKGHTPEGIQKVIDRGRRMDQYIRVHGKQR